MKYCNRRRTRRETVVLEERDVSREAMEASYANQDDVFDKFVGGVEVLKTKVSKLIPKTVIPAPDNEDGSTQKTWAETFPVINPLDEASTTCLIRICHPLRGDMGAWRGIKNNRFYKLADHFGIDKIMTREEFQDKLNSVDYKVLVEEV